MYNSAKGQWLHVKTIAIAFASGNCSKEKVFPWAVGALNGAITFPMLDVSIANEGINVNNQMMKDMQIFNII